MQELVKLLQLQMEQTGSAVLTVTGGSMLPMLHHGVDTVVLEPVAALQEKGALVLYRRESGNYILHRIVKANGSEYICSGDNQWEPEAVSHTQLIGVVTGFTRKGKRYSNAHSGYRLYVRIWVALFPARRYILPLRRLLGRLRKRIRKRR